MSESSITHSGSGVYVSVPLGALRSVTPRTGMDYVRYLELQFENNTRMQMPSAASAELIRRIQEALTAQHYRDSYKLGEAL